MEGLVDSAYWANKRVLVTGHTGFKGSWLCHWLTRMGAQVTGYALEPVSNPSMYNLIGLDDHIKSTIGDIADLKSLQQLITRTAPDVIFHLAAQALVRPAYQDPLLTFETNVTGTANLLQACRELNNPCDVVVVTSDKCYLNREQHHFYVEDDPLGGIDPYSASKACAEIVTASFRDSYCRESGANIRIATARAGNVIGGGDWAEDRLIPDTIRACSANTPVVVRNPKSIRPWQHVLEPLSGYLQLAQKMRSNRDLCRPFNFGPGKDEVLEVGELLNLAAESYPKIELEYSSDEDPHEAKLLMLDAGAAKSALGWLPKWSAREAVHHTFEWYRAWREGGDMKAFTSAQTDDYCQV